MRMYIDTLNNYLCPFSYPLFSRTPPAPLTDDRGSIQPGEQVLLIVEDDVNFADLDMARQQGFKCLVFAVQYWFLMARQFKPDAIMLDIRLPGMDGWTVLDRLKHDPNTRHIPVRSQSSWGDSAVCNWGDRVCKSPSPVRH